MRSLSVYSFLSALVAAATLFSAVHGAVPVDLGLAASYAILAGSAITSTGVLGTVITGNIGNFPGTAITGFPPAINYGKIDAGNGAAAGAQGCLTTAYNALAAKEVDHNLTGMDLGGMTLLPGVYKFDVASALNGMLTLDAGGDVNAVWSFQIGSTFIVSAGSSVVFKNNVGNADYVFWQVGSSATLGAASVTVGNIMALASITVNSDAIVNGRCLARTAAVTLDNNVITKPFRMM